MRLLAALADSTTNFSNSICCQVVVYNDASSENSSADSKNRGSNKDDDDPSSMITMELSYQAAWYVANCHRKWLVEMVGRISAERKIGDPSYQEDFVVAYLASNSIDMLLSMISCSSIRIHRSKKPILPALLNVRWTPDEMANALKSQCSATARTVVLYGQGFETIAKRVISKIEHSSYCFPLEDFSRELLTAKGDVTNVYSTKIYDSQHTTHETETPLETLPSGRHKRQSYTEANDKDMEDDQNDALIVFTSGTTGGSKGVRLSHRAIWIQAMAKLRYPCSYSQSSKMLASTVPLFHVGGLSSCFAVLLAGGTLVFPSTVREPFKVGFDGDVMRRSLISIPMHEATSSPVNTLVVVPAMLVSFFDNEDKRHTTSLASDRAGSFQGGSTAKYPDVKLVLIGGQSASTRVIKRLKLVFPNARIVQTYACTEAASSLTFWHVNGDADNRRDGTRDRTSKRASDLTNRPIGDCVGFPAPHIDIRLYRLDESNDTVVQVRNLNNRIITAPFEPGIIATRGAHVMNGYWDRGCNRQAQRRDNQGRQHTASKARFFLTNDIGFFNDQGRLFFCGRAKDTIRTGGETVFAQEVERVLNLHPNIKECAVFPRVDERFGEAVSCAIVLERIEPIMDIAAIKSWCSRHGLANYKRPRYIFLVDDLPKNSSGKVLKQKLIRQYGRMQSKL